MPADASIYSMIRPQETVPLENPLDIRTRQMQLRDMMGQSQLREIQTRGALRDEETGNRVRDLFASGRPVTQEQVMAVDPLKAGPAYAKSQLDMRKAQADIAKDETETRIKVLERGASILSGAKDQASYELALRTGEQAGVFTPEMLSKLPREFNPQMVAMMRNAGVTEAQRLADERAKEGHDITMRGQDISAGTTIRGQDITDARTRAEGAANRSVSMRGQDLTDARTRDQLGQSRVPAGYRALPDGNLEPIPGGPATKLGEAQVKQKIGVDNTRDAIGEYRDRLKTFGITDTVRPDKRAEMGTVYNNMMLQAKEAFNLGVLNGPDLQILESVIANPNSWSSAGISKKALDAQAAKLDEIMEKIGERVAGTTKQSTPMPTTPSGQSARGRIVMADQVPGSAPSAADIDAELRRRKVIR